VVLRPAGAHLAAILGPCAPILKQRLSPQPIIRRET
jgi:hypothetical protein